MKRSLALVFLCSIIALASITLLMSGCKPIAPTYTEPKPADPTYNEPTNNEPTYTVPITQASISIDGNPTTGYAWTCHISPSGIVKELPTTYKSDPAPQGMTGVGGTYTFNFEAQSKGEADITFNYERSWEDKPPLRTLVYHAVVDDAGNLTLTWVKDS